MVQSTKKETVTLKQNGIATPVRVTPPDSPGENQVCNGQAVPFWMSEKPVTASSVVYKYHNDYAYPEMLIQIIYDTLK